MNDISRKARLIGRILKRNFGYIISTWPNSGPKELYVRSVDEGYAVGETSRKDEDDDWETVYEDPYEAAEAFEEIEQQRLAGH